MKLIANGSSIVVESESVAIETFAQDVAQQLQVCTHQPVIFKPNFMEPQEFIHRLTYPSLLDTQTKQILPSGSLIENGDKMPVFELLTPIISVTIKDKEPYNTSQERVNVTKGIRRKQNIALGFQRTH